MSRTLRTSAVSWSIPCGFGRKLAPESNTRYERQHCGYSRWCRSPSVSAVPLQPHRQTADGAANPLVPFLSELCRGVVKASGRNDLTLIIQRGEARQRRLTPHLSLRPKHHNQALCHVANVLSFERRVSHRFCDSWLMYSSSTGLRFRITSFHNPDHRVLSRACRL